ncbi:MAG: hypothetical protein LPK80_04030 [Bacteroidota bacterium]|nr:hypothetical protein [Bacteroidota bacterium]MDX5427991.1 hypothetical protein [Bacteroidota bacterium]MDX5447423.1 hypothetical protein [Bacteroidota bacterium]MDX5505835.1 hypothetical protein [Bacteroidota bacterium]
MDHKKVTPPGYSTVSPYLIIPDVEKEMSFIVSVFNGDIVEALKDESESVFHGEVRIGNSVVMLGRERPDIPSMESMVYVFTADVDECFRKAVMLGGDPLLEPAKQFYGNKEAGVRSPQGVMYWMAKLVEKVSREEMHQRLEDLKNDNDQ